MSFELNLTSFSFNSRTREGCDGFDGVGHVREEFQFTHPRGVRSARWIAKPGKKGFNSRTREGCDASQAKVKELVKVSIHAPARGAIFVVRFFSRGDLFQFTHPRGVR